MPGWEEHIAKLEELKLLARAAAQSAAMSAAERIAAVAEELAPKRTDLLASTIHATEVGMVGTKAVAVASAGSPATVTKWHGVGYEVFQELGTSNGVPAVHYMANAVTIAEEGMLEQEAEVFVGILKGGSGIVGAALSRA